MDPWYTEKLENWSVCLFITHPWRYPKGWLKLTNQDWFCKPTWRPFHFLEHRYGCCDVTWTRSIGVAGKFYKWLHKTRVIWNHWWSPINEVLRYRIRGICLPGLLWMNLTALDPSVYDGRSILGSLRSYDGDAEKTSIKKWIYILRTISRDTLKSFTLFFTVKTITKLNLRHSDKFEIEI